MPASVPFRTKLLSKVEFAFRGTHNPMRPDPHSSTFVLLYSTTYTVLLFAAPVIGLVQHEKVAHDMHGRKVTPAQQLPTGIHEQTYGRSASHPTMLS